MSNMSYCRFYNTLRDLQDCYRNWNEPDDLSEAEREAQTDLLKLCKRIVENYDEDED